jgi:hypothetical protein
MLKMSRKKGFDTCILEAVDEALSVLGESSKQAFYSLVEKSHNIKREEIPEKIEIFHGALTDILGVGSKIMERLIARMLYRKLVLDFEEREEWTLVDYLRDLSDKGID